METLENFIVKHSSLIAWLCTKGFIRIIENCPYHVIEINMTKSFDILDFRENEVDLFKNIVIKKQEDQSIIVTLYFK